MKLMFTILFFTLFLGCNTVYDEKLEAVNSGKEISAEGIILQWQIDGNMLNIILKAPTTGWVAVGFNPTQQMLDANIIIGFVAGSNIEIRDDYGDSAYTHSSDVSLGGSDDVTNISGIEESGITTLNFTIPLESSDIYDRILFEGTTYPVILAYGSNDDFDSIHDVRTTIVIEL